MFYLPAFKLFLLIIKSYSNVCFIKSIIIHMPLNETKALLEVHICPFVLSFLIFRAVSPCGRRGEWKILMINSKATFVLQQILICFFI